MNAAFKAGSANESNPGNMISSRHKAFNSMAEILCAATPS
jgi:hypothetical protein